MSADPPGFGPAGQVPELHGEPLAAPAVRGRRVFLALMAFFAVVAVGSGAAFFLTQGGDVHSAAPVTGREIALPRPTGAEATVPAGPVPKPVRYTGSGDKTIAIRKPEPGTALLYVKGNAARQRFFVTRLGTGGAMRGVVLAKFEPYEGVKLLDEGLLNQTASLRIEATGPWTVEIRSPRGAPLLRRSASGRTDTVLRYEGGVATATIAGGKFGSGAFAVRTHRGDGFSDLVMVALDRERERKPWPAGPVLVVVEAGAPWSLTLG